MPERNRQDEAEIHMKDNPKDPPEGGDTSNPTQPGVQTNPPSKGGDDLD